MIKNKTFTANIHAHSIGGEKISFFNTNTNTKIPMESTNHVLTFQAKDKHEVRRQVGKRVWRRLYFLHQSNLGKIIANKFDFS